MIILILIDMNTITYTGNIFILTFNVKNFYEMWVSMQWHMSTNVAPVLHFIVSNRASIDLLFVVYAHSKTLLWRWQLSFSLIAAILVTALSDHLCEMTPFSLHLALQCCVFTHCSLQMGGPRLQFVCLLVSVRALTKVTTGVTCSAPRLPFVSFLTVNLRAYSLGEKL